MARMTGRRGFRSGFTLIEAVSALAILAVLVYLAAGSFLNLAPKYRLEKAVWEVVAALNGARAKAIFESADFRVKFGSSGYRVEKKDETTQAWIPDRQASLEGVATAANNTPVFTPEGSVTGLATITVTNAWGGYKITLAITGRIKTARS
jgi:prepilin-type N-terminal cleavage/methylation domain-containing protein